MSMMCDLIEERDVIEMLERSVPVPFRMEPDIDSFVGIMKSICPERFVSKGILYHYTKKDVLEKLMADDGDILCGHYKDMNDDGEWDLGVEHILDYISSLKLLPEIVESFENVVEEIHSRNPPCIASFSAHMDKASMWGMYTDRQCGGYAIGIKRDVLEGLCKRNNQNNKLHEVYFLPCLYLGEDDVDAVIDHVLDNHADEIEYTARHTPFEVGELLVRKLLVLSCLIKDASFDYENEWRLILCPLDSAIQEKRTKIVSEGKEREALFSGLFGNGNPIRNSVYQIIVSPQGSASVLRENAVAFRKRYLLGFDLSLSSSTYNGR